jgi:hypothetical protein
MMKVVKPKYSRVNLCQCHFVRHKGHMKWPETWACEVWHTNVVSQIKKIRFYIPLVPQLVEALLHRTGDFVFDSRWVPWRLSGDLSLLFAFSNSGVYSASNRNCHQSAVDAWSWQLYRPSCAGCQSKYGSPNFHSPSESPCLVRESFTFTSQ